MKSSLINRILRNATENFQKGNLQNAATDLKEILKGSPGNFDALHMMGVICGIENNHQKAIYYLSQAVRLNPRNNFVNFNFAKALSETGQDCEAIKYHQEAVRLDKNHAESWLNFGKSLFRLGQNMDALTHYDRAIQLRPEYVEAWFNKGITLNELKLHNEALSHYDRAIQLRPEYVEAWVNKGITLNELNLHNEALSHYDRAIQLRPEYAEAWLNKGVTLNELKLHDEALSHYDRAIQLRPEYVEAKFNKGLLSLFLKKFDSGWEHCESRLKDKNIFNFEFPIDTKITPIWNGKLACKSLLIISEQGIGDHIFYMSFLDQVRLQIKEITVIADPRLIPIFSRSFPGVTFLEQGASLNITQYDFQVALASLPMILKINTTMVESSRKPFLIDKAKLTLDLKNSEVFSGKLNCGVAWQSLNKKIGNSKSIRLTELREILQIPYCNYINLKYGDVTVDLMEAERSIGVKISSVKDIDVFSDIDGLLSIIKACDVVITTSNVTAHLAGAIGKKTFLLLPYSKGRFWYWHEEKVSTWYPCITQYYQSADFSWGAAVKEIAHKLGDEIARKN